MPIDASQALQLAEQLDIDPAKLNAIVKALTAGETDVQLPRIREQTDAAITRGEAKHQTAIRREESTLRMRLQDKQAQADLNLKIAAGNASAAQVAAETRVMQLAEAGDNILRMSGQNYNVSAGGATPDPITAIADQIDKLAKDAPIASEMAAELRSNARVQADTNIRRAESELGALARKSKVRLGSDQLRTMAEDSLKPENAGKMGQFKTEIRAQRRSRDLEYEKVTLRRAMAGDDKRVMETLEELIDKVSPASGEASTAETRMPRQEIKRLRTKELPSLQKAAKFRKFGRAGGIAAAGGGAMALILNNIFGKEKDTTEVEGLSNQQKFQLALTLAGNKGIGGQGGGDSLQQGRELGNMQKMLTLINTLKQMQGLMGTPQQQIGFS